MSENPKSSARIIIIFGGECLGSVAWLGEISVLDRNKPNDSWLIFFNVIRQSFDFLVLHAAKVFVGLVINCAMLIIKYFLNWIHKIL
jgi:hypothetical protein